MGLCRKNKLTINTRVLNNKAEFELNVSLPKSLQFQRAHKKRMKQTIYRELAKTSAMTETEEGAVMDIWSLSLQDRWRLYRWVCSTVFCNSYAPFNPSCCSRHLPHLHFHHTVLCMEKKKKKKKKRTDLSTFNKRVMYIFQETDCRDKSVLLLLIYALPTACGWGATV